MKKAYFVIPVLLLLFLSPALPAFAQTQKGLVPCGYDLNPKDGVYDSKTEGCKPCHIFLLVDRILDFVFFVLVPVVAVLMVVIGGFMFITGGASPLEALQGGAKGGPQGLKKGKDILTATVTGLVIVYASWLVINLFFVMIGVQDWTELNKGLFQIKCP